MHILVSDGGTHTHMSHNGGHHSGREFRRSGMAASAVGAKTFLALYMHVFILCALLRGNRWSRRIFRGILAAAGQDVEVKPGTPTDQKTQPAPSSKDKKSKDKKSGESKVLRNP